MGQSVGALTVLLGLDAAEYTRGLTRAERQAQQFAQNTRNAILSVGKVLGSLAIGSVVLQNAKDIVAEAAALNDLSDATGSSVESLSRLSNQAKIAGTDFATLQGALIKLSAGMSGADEDSTKAKEALRILGITAKDPVEALQQVAVKLNGYADGVNKVGLAVALFGKQGGQFLATLKDIAELQDVGATITKRQAEEAENLEKAFRRLSVEATGFKNAILNDLVPALTTMIEDMRNGTQIAGGFLNAILQFGTLNPFDRPREGINKLQAEIDKFRNQKVGVTDLALINDFDAEIKLRANQIAFLKTKELQVGRALIDPSNSDARDLLAQRRPQAPNPPGGGSGKAVKQQVDEAERLLDSLLKQQQATLDLTTEETARVAILDIELKTMKEVNAATKEAILDSARQIDQAKAREKAERDAAKAAEEFAKAKDRREQDIARAVEATQRETESVRGSNEAVREQIIELRGGEKALQEYIAAKNEQIAAEKEARAALIEAADGSKDMVLALREQAAAIRERNKVAGELNLAKQFADDARAMQDVKNLFADAFASNFADFISGTKSAKEAFRSFAEDVVRQINRIAAQKLANALFGGNSGGDSDFFGAIAKLFASMGSGSSGGGSVYGGPQYGGYAMGGVARGGGAWVGENGPEWMNLPAGARITPNNQLRNSMGAATINNYLTVPPGADMASIRQAAKRGTQLGLSQTRRG